MNSNFFNSSIDKLCPNCGLCCDGTLFADVELRAGDDAKRLQKSGLKLHAKTKTKRAFSQPCACFDGALCKIYADRPRRCAAFACGLLKRVEAGKMTAGAALKKISVAKAKAAKVRELLGTPGQRHRRMALTLRYAGAMVAPMDFSRPDDAARRGELMLAMADLQRVLQRDFLSQ